jgi:hypothetical protein
MIAIYEFMGFQFKKNNGSLYIYNLDEMIRLYGGDLCTGALKVCWSFNRNTVLEVVS